MQHSLIIPVIQCTIEEEANKKIENVPVPLLTYGNQS